MPAEAARRLLLAGGGLLDDRARSASPRSVAQIIRRLGFVQVDTINIVGRAHHLILRSRLDAYQPGHLRRLLERDRAFFEHWTHDASVIPLEWFHHWKPRFERERMRIPAGTWWRTRMGDKADAIIDDVRGRIERDGPLQSRDFEHDGRTESWWGWKPQKAALEFLWRTGELAIARRQNFRKVYDLTERVYPEAFRRPAPEAEAHIEWACSTAIERLGVATPVEIAAFWRAIDSPSARRWCEQAARDGRVMTVSVESADGSPPKRAYAVADWEQRLDWLPEPPLRMRLLAPFDPVLRDRTRAKRLFDFDYRFEAFVPAPQRVYGYYVMPILEGDQLVGRVDPKFDRKRGELIIQDVWWQPNVRATKKRRAMLEEAVNQLAVQIGADYWSLPE